MSARAKSPPAATRPRAEGAEWLEACAPLWAPPERHIRRIR